MGEPFARRRVHRPHGHAAGGRQGSGRLLDAQRQPARPHCLPGTAIATAIRQTSRAAENTIGAGVAESQSSVCIKSDLVLLPAERRRERVEEYLLAEFAAIAHLTLTHNDRERPLQALGLDSLMALQFRNRLERSFESAPSVVDFLKGLSLNQLVDFLLSNVETGPAVTAPSESAPSEPALSVAFAVASDGIPLSFNQQALWFVYQLAPRSPAYNFLFAARIAGMLDKPALVRAFAVLVRRHPALRTRFAVHDNQPVQIFQDVMPLSIPVVDVAGKSRREIEEICQRRGDEPFDLQRGPALRRVACRLGDRDDSPARVPSPHHRSVVDGHFACAASRGLCRRGHGQTVKE